MDSFPISSKNTSEFVKLLKEHDIQNMDCNFTDIRGKLQHTTQDISSVDETLLKEGIFFDGSSIAGWKNIDESDMNLRFDLGRIAPDPFTAQPTVKIFCDVYEPKNNQPYQRDPRSIAKKAEKYLVETGIADRSYFGPEAEFFIFDDVRHSVDMNKVGYEIDSEEGPYNSGRQYNQGNMGHRPGVKGGYFPEAPVDSLADIRAEMLTVMAQMGLKVEKHHHEVAPGQCELGFRFDTLTKVADNLQIYKHCVFNVAHSYGKTATFMPKPVYGDNGSGMHVHQSLWKGEKNLFAGEEYAGLSETCLFYIGGIMKHARSLNAFTNPTTNSYKRLVPGYEAPVVMAYSARNRSAACRIPYTLSPQAKRIELRFPDPTANPYLAFSAMLMAGLDGIKNKIHPGEAVEKNLYNLPQDELSKYPHVCNSLRRALETLREEHEFLLQGDVFTKDMIEGYINLKMEEVEYYETMPHPVEFQMYYSC